MWRIELFNVPAWFGNEEQAARTSAFLSHAQ